MGTRIEIGPDDSGTEVTVGVGDRVVVRLPENPTTGWRWQASGSFDPIVLIGDSYDQTPAGSGVGAAATRVLEFVASSAGHVILQLVRVREWEDLQSADAQFTITVIVSEPTQP